MKKLYTCIVFTIVVSVFTASFLIGRATALKKDNEGKSRTYYGTVLIPRDSEKTVETSEKAEKVPKESENTEKESTDVSLPDRMIFPCGEKVQKEYSQFAVYSETMGDWRAHTGVDFSADVGTEVLCVLEGTVLKTYKDKLWGNCIEIMHLNNLKSVYKNLNDEIRVKKGEVVFEGQVIGFVGKSAPIEGMEQPHLHFEMWQDSVTINPSSYVY